MRIHIRGKRRRKNSSRYPLKPTSFLTSAGVHAAIVAVLFLTSPVRPGLRSTRPLYDAEIKPNEKKIIWYNFRQTVPNLPATTKIGTAKHPQGEVISPQVVIATSRDAISKQFIWQPAAQKKIEQEIKAPNVVAVKPAEAPPAPVEKAVTPPAPKPVTAPAPVKPEEGPAVVKQPPRQYQPPPQPAPPKITLKTPTITDAPPPDATVLGGASPLVGVQTTALSQLKIPPKQYVPPNMSRYAGKGVGSAKVGTITAPAPDVSVAGNVNMAIVGLHPSDTLPSLPSGSLPGKFSTAPNAGKASTGNLPISASGVPNLMVGGGSTASSGAAAPPAPSIPKKTILYRQVATGQVPSTLSAPLHPGIRRLPAAVEARFQGRDVYTMVLPAPNLPVYAGDWVMWFANLQPNSEELVQMRAPLPYRKRVPEQGSEAAGKSVIRVQVAGLVGRDGKLEQLKILKGGGPEVAKQVLEDLKAWEFTPATRNMVPVEVEVVLEIAFRE